MKLTGQFQTTAGSAVDGPLSTTAEPVEGSALSPIGRAFLEGLFRSHILTPTAVAPFLAQNAEQLPNYVDGEGLGGALVQAGLLTEYQLARILAGKSYGLVLGNHRVVNRLGAGGMGVVFLAEHIFMKRQVAVKVLPMNDDCPGGAVERFYAEMRVLAELQHPNIVQAFDAGKLLPPGPGMPPLLYLAMELVPGGDLEQYVLDHGPVAVAQACDWVCQAAYGIQEAHDNHLIHRDVKPSNLLRTLQGRIKVVDFGLVRQFSSQVTQPHVLLGTVEFMAPEQSYDASSVGSQADIYGLGATLLWLLTGKTPYPPARSLAQAIRLLQETRPQRLGSLRSDVPHELDCLVDRMLDPDPTRRPGLPLTVIKALQPFCQATATTLQPRP